MPNNTFLAITVVVTVLVLAASTTVVVVVVVYHHASIIMIIIVVMIIHSSSLAVPNPPHTHTQRHTYTHPHVHTPCCLCSRPQLHQMEPNKTTTTSATHAAAGYSWVVFGEVPSLTLLPAIPSPPTCAIVAPIVHL